MKKVLVTVSVLLGVILLMKAFSKGKNVIKTNTVNKMANEILNDKFKVNNQKYINNLNKVAIPIFSNFLNDIIKMGFAVYISSGYRDSAKQAQLKKDNPKNASAGFSTHEYGIALDLNLVKDGKWINKSSPLNDWINTGVVRLAKEKYNFRWGGDFTGYKDPIHFDMGKRYDINKLYAMAIKQYGSAEKIQGNKLKLV